MAIQMQEVEWNGFEIAQKVGSVSLSKQIAT